MKTKIYLLFPKTYRFLYFLLLLKNFIKDLFNNNELATAEISKEIYNKYDNSEIIDYKKNKTITIMKEKYVLLSFKEIRKIYHEYLNDVIDNLLKNKSKIRILEVGCGNCINIIKLKERYGDKIVLYGIDISEERIKIAKEEFGDKLKSVKLGIEDITSKTSFNDSEFDLIFSIHVLEQLPYQVKDALIEYYRLSNNKILLIEPTWEHADYLQKMYLIYSDHVRFLYGAIKLLNYNISLFEKSKIQSNIYNPSSVILINK